MKNKIIAAVPNYNGGKMLLNIVEQLKEHPFDDIYVLDDLSTDNSVKKIEQEHSDIKLIKGNKNLGPGGNRNRIIDELGEDIDAIFFVDADMKLLSKNIVKYIRKIFCENKNVGMLGGMIFDKKMQPMEWNYGYEMDPIKDVLFLTLRKIIGQKNVLKKLRDLDMDYHWVSPKKFALKKRTVDWVAEGFCAVRASLFKDLKGYDSNMRYHEIHDLTYRIRSKGYEVLFTPDIHAQHLELEVRGKKRRKRDLSEAQFYFLKKRWSINKKERARVL